MKMLEEYWVRVILIGIFSQCTYLMCINLHLEARLHGARKAFLVNSRIFHNKHLKQ